MLFLILALLTSSASAAQPVKVAVIDTGLDVSDVRFKGHLCEGYHHDFTGTGLEDHYGHGTHVAGLIMKYAGDANYCMVIIKYYDVHNERSNFSSLRLAMEYARDIGAKIVNYSGGGPYYSKSEYEFLKTLTDMTLVVAAGNDGEDLDRSGYKFYPAYYPLGNIYAVGALNSDGTRFSHSNYGARVTRWERGVDVLSLLPGGKRGYMTGTSQATAIHTGKLVNQLFSN